MKMQVLRAKIPRGMCAKLRTVAESNNRNLPMRSLYYCYFVPAISYYCYFYAKASHCGSKQQKSSHSMITQSLLVRATNTYFCSSRASRSWWITQTTQRNTTGEVATQARNIASFSHALFSFHTLKFALNVLTFQNKIVSTFQKQK